MATALNMKPRVTYCGQSTMATLLSVFVTDSKQASDILSSAGRTSRGSEQVVRSLLDRLRALQKSKQTCEHLIRTIRSTDQSHHKKWPSCSADPKSMTPLSRVCEFPSENVTVSFMLFSRVSVILNIIDKFMNVQVIDKFCGQCSIAYM